MFNFPKVENPKDESDKICNCINLYCTNAIEQLNRQKAEIERLQRIIVGFMDEVGTWSNKYEVDISTILKLPLLAKEDFNIRNKIKSEAIKEFAERLTDKADLIKANALDSRWAIWQDDIDNLVKEMTEGSKC
jgi:predicted GNAT family acetyltransferase